MSYLITGSALTPFEVRTLREAITAVEEYTKYGHKGMKIWYPPDDTDLENQENANLVFSASALRERAVKAASEARSAQATERGGARKTLLDSLDSLLMDRKVDPKETCEDVTPLSNTASDAVLPGKEYGQKFDSGKLRFSLVPMDVFTEVLEVLEFGARKYSPDNWKFVDKPNERYLNAAFRHLFLANNGPRDAESGKLHVAHAICCLLFLGWFDLEDERCPF